MKKILIYVTLLGGCLMGMNSCELFGLSYAYSFQNEKASDFSQIQCNAMEWIESRRNIDMSLQYEAIMRAGVDSIYRDTTNSYTFLLLTDEGWDDYLTSTKASSLQEISPVELRSYILGYITYGVYTVKDVDVPLYVPTLGKYTMRYYKCIVAPTSSQNLNSFYCAWWFGEGISFQNRGCITSNLTVTNGVMHILGQRLIVKTK